METIENIVERLKNEGKDGTDTETLIIVLKKTKILHEDDEHKEETLPKSCMKELVLKSVEFYIEKIGISPAGFTVTSQIYNQLGQYDYGGADCTGDLMQKTGTSKTGKKILYIGQFKTGTKIEDGIGISVWNSGDIYEGYYKDGKKNGIGRCIYHTGNYCIAEFKNGHRVGECEYHYSNGAIYKGQFNNGRNGYGTMTYPSGKIKTGQWKNDMFLG